MTGFESYMRAGRRRWARERADDAAAAHRARAVARRLAKILARSYGARRVYLCASLARGEVQQGSDIDLVAEGIAGAKVFEAGAHPACERMNVVLADLEGAALDAAASRLRDAGGEVLARFEAAVAGRNPGILLPT